MTANDFRRLALGLPEAVESAHMGHPDFRVGGKIFATLDYPGAGWAMVGLTRDQQELFVNADPKAFVPVKGGWGERGATNVRLQFARAAVVREALGEAWRNRAPKRLARESDEIGRSAGYSGTPLAKKLGYKPFGQAVLIDAPADYAAMVQPLPENVVIEKVVTKKTDLVHVFVTDRKRLLKHLSALRKKIKPDSSVWVSWPKKSSKVSTDVTEDVIRDVALPLGFVDVKVCAVSEVWSGLKLVVRKELR